MWKRLVSLFLFLTLGACAGLEQSQNEVPPTQAPPKDAALLSQQVVAAQEQSARLEVRISRFEQEISDLQKVIRELENQQRRLQQHLFRLGRELESRTSTLQVSSGASSTESMSSPKRNETTERKPTAQSIRKAFEQSNQLSTASNSESSEGGGTIIPQAPVDLSRPTPSQKPPSTMPASTSSSPQEAYNQAYRAVREKKNKQAIVLFRNFIRRFPTNRLAANAQYWLAEGYYDMRDYPTSLAEFQKVVSRYPKSRKVPDAIYKSGLTQLRMKDPHRASVEFEKLINRFPNHPLTQRARRQLQALRQSKGQKNR